MKYYNAESFEWICSGYAKNFTHAFIYPVPADQSRLDLIYSIQNTSITKVALDVLVNDHAITDLSTVIPKNENRESSISVSDLQQGDQVYIKVHVDFVNTIAGSQTGHFIIGMSEAPTALPAKHVLSFFEGTDCLEDGLAPHFRCDRCGQLFPVADQENPTTINEAYYTSDDLAVTEEDLYHSAYDSHLHEEDVLQPNGLYTNRCERCAHLDTDSWVAKNAIGDEDLFLTGSDDEGFTTSAPLSLAYGNSYTVPVPFTASTLNYSVPAYAGSWSSWSVPFEVNTDQLAEAGFDAAYIEGIHRYDTDDDGAIDRTPANSRRDFWGNLWDE